MKGVFFLMKKKIALLLFTVTMSLTACSSDNFFDAAASKQAAEASLSQETVAESTITPASDASEVETQGSDSAIYAYLENLYHSPDNPSNWSDEQIGLSGITDIQSDEFKAIISSWQEKIADYEQSCIEKCAEEFNMSVDDVDAAYLRELTRELSK